MIPETTVQNLRGACRVLQIVVLALAMGVGAFAVVAIMQTNGQFRWDIPPQQFQDSVFLIFGLVAFVASFVVPSLLPAVAEARDSGSEKSVPAMRAARTIHIRTIIGCALLEGGAFANLMAVYTDGCGPSLVLAAILMSSIVLRFPTWNRYLDQIEAAVQRGP